MASQTHKEEIKIEVNDVIYTIRNSPYYTIDDIFDELAEKMYDKVRMSTSDVTTIPKNTSLKTRNIRSCKQHIFIYN